MYVNTVHHYHTYDVHVFDLRPLCLFIPGYPLVATCENVERFIKEDQISEGKYMV
jgi:hypothetical protein